MADLLAVARLQDMESRALILVALGMQFEVMEPGWRHSEAVATRRDALVDVALAQVRC